jgi:hypothetical protein
MITEDAEVTGQETESQEVESQEVVTQETESPEGEKTENSEPTEHELYKLLKEEYKDHPFEKEEDYLSKAHELVSGLKEYKAKNSEANQTILELFESQPELGNVLRDMAQGSSFAEALARHIDLDGLKKKEGDPEFEKWNKAKAERAERLAKQKETESSLSAARQESLKTLNEYMSEKNLKEDFTQKIDELINPLFEGKITREFLEIMNKAIYADQAIEKAKEQAAIKTRNEKIVEKKIEKEGDGLPNLSGSGKKPTEKPNKKNYGDILGIDEFNKRRAI